MALVAVGHHGHYKGSMSWPIQGRAEVVELHTGAGTAEWHDYSEVGGYACKWGELYMIFGFNTDAKLKGCFGM